MYKIFVNGKIKVTETDYDKAYYKFNQYCMRFTHVTMTDNEGNVIVYQ